MEKSTCVAVIPPTRTVRPVPASALRDDLAAELVEQRGGLRRLGGGARVETATAAVPAGLTCGGVDGHDPRLAGHGSSATRGEGGLVAMARGWSATSWSGPLKPGPKPFASRS